MNDQALRKSFFVQKLVLLLNYAAYGFGLFPILEFWIVGALLLQPWAARLSRRGHILFRTPLLPMTLTLLVPAVAILIISRSDGFHQLVGENLFITLLALFCVRHAFATRGSDVFTGAALLLTSGFSLLLLQGPKALGAPRLFGAVNILFSFYSIYLAHGRGNWLELEKNDAAVLRRVLIRLLPIVTGIYLFVPELRDYWRNAASTMRASTGFSITLRPGDIAQLENDDTLVATLSPAEKKSPAAPHAPTNPDTLLNAHYLRGATLSTSLGMEWDASAVDFKVSDRWSPHIMTSGHAAARETGTLRVEILNPEDGTLFTPFGAQLLTSSSTLRIASMVNGTYRLQGLPGGVSYHYDLAQDARPATHSETKLDRPHPVHSEVRYWTESRQARKMLEQWKEYKPDLHLANARGTLAQIRELFGSKGFTYASDLSTLVNRGNTLTLDQFLFANKRGFCEHYAAATASLLRLAGVPSRVVVGYAFPQWNPALQKFLLRRSNAHAWIEWWDAESDRWRPEDPTSWVPGGQIGGISSRNGQFDFTFVRDIFLTAQGVIDRLLVNLRSFQLSPEGIERVTTVLRVIGGGLIFWLVSRTFEHIRSLGAGADKKLFEDTLHTAARMTGQSLNPFETLTDYFARISRRTGQGAESAMTRFPSQIAESLNRLTYASLEATERQKEREHIRVLMKNWMAQLEAHKPREDAQEQPTRNRK